MTDYNRRSGNINRKFYHFLLPTVLTGFATSLNEFVDSIIVSQLLGPEAMSMVGMASPIIFVFAVVFILIGSGGAALYAEYSGRLEKRKAEELFSVVLIVSIIISVVLAIVGIVLIDPLCNWMCKNPDMISEFKPYTIVLLLSGILIIPIQFLASFFPAFGSPHTGTIVNIIANGVNLVLDVVYIRFFNTGLKGAAMATFTGYLVGMVFIVVMILMKRIPFPFVRVGIKEIPLLCEAAAKGAPASIGQLGFLIKISFCNQIAMEIGGMIAIATFTLCIQTLSVVSIAMAGIIGAMVPIGSALNGQRDFKGLKILLKSVFLVQFVSSLILTVLFEAFPQFVCYIYNYTGENAQSAIVGIRIFSLMFVFRGGVLIFQFYFQVINRKLYASIISCIDGFVGLIPVALILVAAFGINGLWMAFPILAILMLVVIVVINLVIAGRSNGKYQGVMLSEVEDSSIRIYDATFMLGQDVISDFIVFIQDFCNKNIYDKKDSMMIAVALEEMISYTQEHSFSKMPVEEIDIMVKIKPKEVLMDIRSVGEPIDPTTATGEKYSNVEVLKKVATKLEYNYVIGMNHTRITMPKIQQK